MAPLRRGLGRAGGVGLAGAVLLAAAAGACGGEPGGGEGGGPDGEGPPVIRAGRIEVTDPVVTEPLAGGAGALYMGLADRGGEPGKLIGLTVAGAEASLHRTEEREGRTAMTPVDEIDLGPGGGVRLRPGGYHGMIRWIGEAPVAGDTVGVTLRFDRGDPLTVPAPVTGHGEALERHPPGEP